MRNFQVQRFISLPGVFFFLLKNFVKQKSFLKKEIERDLIPFEDNTDGSLQASDFKKITSFYALGVPAILGESLSFLRQKPLSIQERFCLTYLGGISGLLDDLFDDPDKKADHLKHFILEPERLVPSNSHEELLLKFYLKGLSFSEKPDRLKRQAQQVFITQQNSLRQQNKNLTEAEMDAITYSKGGSSFIFYRLCLTNPLEKPEEEFLYKLGNVMQLGSDIFDVWEDYTAGVETAATKTTNIKTLRLQFKNELDSTYNLAKKNSYSPLKINQFIFITEFALARVFVCLDQFEKLQKKSGGVFKIANYSRKELICDMEKPVNQINSLKYYLSPIKINSKI